MCKAIVVGNDESSTKSRLVKRLASMGIEIVASTSWSNLHQADPKDAELVVFNTSGLPGKLNDVAARARGWGLPIVPVFASKHETKLDGVLRWQGARAERKKHVPSPVEAAPTPPSPPQGPPCVVCGKPVNRKVTAYSGKGKDWAKTCGAQECVRAARAAGARKGNEVQAQAAKAKSGPVEAEAPVVTETAIVPTTPLQLVVLDGDTEPRALDTDIAERAELAQPRNVRQVIEKNRAELEEHGVLVMRTVRMRIEKTGAISGFENRDVPAYYLNEDQSYALLALLKTEPAKRFRVELLKLFKAYRNGELASKAPQVVSARDQLRLLLQSQDELEARVNGKVGELSNKLEGLDSFAGNLESEQERIEREAKERAEQERKERVEAIATLRAKQEEIEDALTRPRGPVQTTIVNTRVIGDKGAVEIFDAIKAMAVSAARERMREDWDSLDWVALYLWCDSFIYAHSRDSAGVYGTSASLTFSQAEAWRGALTEDLRRETIAWTRDRRIPSSYHKRAKVYRHKPIQQKSNVIKLVKPEEPEAS